MGKNCRYTPLAAIVTRTYLYIYNNFVDGNEQYINRQ